MAAAALRSNVGISVIVFKVSITLSKNCLGNSCFYVYGLVIYFNINLPFAVHTICKKVPE